MGGKNMTFSQPYTSPNTCYNYHTDLGIWGRWLTEAGND